jgi:hypothetical protein
VSGPVNGVGGLRALPAPSDDNPLIAAIRNLLPERSSEDRARGEIPVSFGVGEASEVMRIPVLFARANRAWQDTFKAAMQKLVADVEADDTGAAVVALLTGATDLQLELLEAYNPERLSAEWMGSHATEEQILDAFLQVTAASYPFVISAARTLLASPEVGRWARLQLVQLLYSSSTSSSSPSTGTARAKSKKN